LNTIDLWLKKQTPGAAIPPDSEVIKIEFLTTLSKRNFSAIALEQYDSTNAPLASCNSAEIDLPMQCGYPAMESFLNGVPFQVTSIVPNPAANEIAITVSKTPGVVSYELSDALGRPALSGVDIPPTLNVSGLPSGVYYLRLSQDGFVVTRRIVIER